MAFFSDCPGCLSGNHSKHVHHWGVRPEGVIDGDFCDCPGDCAERAQAMFDEFFGNMADIFSEEALSPEARDLVEGLRSTDPAIRNAAVRKVNRLLDEDPLVGGPDETGGA